MEIERIRVEIIAPENRKIKLQNPPKSITALRNHIKLTFGLKANEYKLYYVDSENYKCMVHNNDTYANSLEETESVITYHVEPKIINLAVS
jgi:hypothetical protein